MRVMNLNFPNQPTIIQGGMGIAVSNWRLANAVASRGGLGVISGTAIELVISRRLQQGDPDGVLREAFDAFPLREIADRVWSRYFVPGGKDPEAPYKSKPLFSIKPTKALLELTVIANFAEVWLAKKGHKGVVGINLLEKIQLPTVPSLFGAMLAGVDYVLMGAGIPRQIPAILDKLAAMEPASLKLDVAGTASGEEVTTDFDPAELGDFGVDQLKRPQFLAIVSSTALATNLVKKCQPPVDGLIIEGATAGGHNAPPRGTLQLDEAGEPIYGPRDEADLEAIKELGKPFWLAGSWGTPEKYHDALAVGAAGVQMGTAFAFCDESGVAPEIKAQVLKLSLEKKLKIKTDAFASPTGFPFKVVSLEGTISEEEVFENRVRICDLGYLRQLFKDENGKIGYRCASEPIEDFVAKGGTVEEALGRKCICNALAATADYGQKRKTGEELPLMTAGNEVVNVSQYIPEGKTSYSVGDVFDRILGTK